MNLRRLEHTVGTGSRFLVILAVSEAIREARRIESGTLYALLCDRLTLSAYQGVISALKGAELVSEANHMLTWIGPELR